MVFPQPRIRQPDTQQLLGQVASQDSHGTAASIPERRCEERTDLSMLVLAVPMNGELPDISRVFPAISQNVSSGGICVLANRFLLTPEVVLCFSEGSEIRLLRAAVRHRKELGLGWVRFGVEVTGTVDRGEYPQLRHFVETLLR